MLNGPFKGRYRIRMHTNCQWTVPTLKQAEELARELRKKHGDLFLLTIEIEKLEPLTWLKGWTRWPNGWQKITREVH